MILHIIVILGQSPERGACAGPGPSPLRRQDSGYDTSGLTPEEQVRLNSGVDYIQNIVGDTMSENVIKVC